MIPKKIHLTWKTKDIENCDSELIRQGFTNMKLLNPGWIIELSDDQDLDNYLSSTMATSDYERIKNCHPVVKSDVWRLYKLFYEGGLYVDLDRLWNVSLDSIITDKIKWVLPTCLDVDFSHDFMCTAPGNPAFATAIDMQLTRRRQGHAGVYYLGPQTYMHAVSHTLLGRIVDSNPSSEVFNELRDAIMQTDFILTYIECPPQDTIIFRNNEHIDHEKMKREMYGKFNLKHWTGEW